MLSDFVRPHLVHRSCVIRIRSVIYWILSFALIVPYSVLDGQVPSIDFDSFAHADKSQAGVVPKIYVVHRHRWRPHGNMRVGFALSVDINQRPLVMAPPKDFERLDKPLGRAGLPELSKPRPASRSIERQRFCETATKLSMAWTGPSSSGRAVGETQDASHLPLHFAMARRMASK